MTDNTNNDFTEEIIMFVKKIIYINRSLRSSYGLTNVQDVLKLFNNRTKHNDSGFESEPCLDSVDTTCLVPTRDITHILFEKNDLDSILEHSLNAFCNYIQNIDLDSKEKLSINEKILDFATEFTDFLIEVASNVPFREIIQTCLVSMLDESFASDNYLKFNFIMKLLQRFGSIKELQECVLDLILKKMKTFSKSTTVENVNTSFSFRYECDFNRAYTLLLTLMEIKADKSSYSKQNVEDICGLLDNFKNLDNFFSLGFLSYKSLTMG